MTVPAQKSSELPLEYNEEMPRRGKSSYYNLNHLGNYSDIMQ